jgi:6-phosphogluconolactonase
MASRSLLDRVPIPCERIHRMRGEDPNPERAAIEHEHRLREALGIGRGEPPDFDLVLLGMGADAHVASLFPGDPQVLVEDRLVVAVEHDRDPPPRVDRLSLTAPALSAGRATLFVVVGGEKASAARAALEGPYEPGRIPAQRVAPAEPAVWLLDGSAASHLTR